LLKYTTKITYVGKCLNIEVIFVPKVAPVAGSIEFPVLKNLRTLLLDRCDLRDNYRLLRHCLRNSASLERLTIRLCEAPAVSTGGKGRTKSKKMYSHFQNLMRFQCQKFKHTKVIYKEGGEIQGLVGFFSGYLRLCTQEYYNAHQV
ncbi:hypothetical protein EJB05_37863, partial [Eragrostis curvula]